MKFNECISEICISLSDSRDYRFMNWVKDRLWRLYDLRPRAEKIQILDDVEKQFKAKKLSLRGFLPLKKIVSNGGGILL